MFSYCNRNNNKSITNDTIYNYSTFSNPRDRFLCDGSYQQQMVNRGVPSDLIDINTNLRGQNSKSQNYCMNENDSSLNFSTFRPMMFPPQSQGPCMAVVSYKGSSSCSQVNNLNQSRPIYGYPNIQSFNGERF